MTSNPTCWCGNTDLLPFTEQYLRCPVCETLVWNGIAEEPAVSGDEEGYYGREYFLSHQNALGLPDLYQRARNDLVDRCQYWLRAILKYHLPPAASLEIGCSHGAFVAAMRQAGYEATGIDLSPWVVEFGRTAFGIPVLAGAIGDHHLQPRSFDLIILMDVLEHLPDPQRLLTECARLLKPDGILVIQSPEYPTGSTIESLKSSGTSFIKMMIPQEHIYLFSRPSVTKLLNRAGFMQVKFEPALFSGQDFFLFASREAYEVNPPEMIQTWLESSPSGRMSQAQLDLYASLESANQDRAARLDQIHLLTGFVHEREDRLAAAERQVADLAGRIAELERLPYILRLARRLLRRLQRVS